MAGPSQFERLTTLVRGVFNPAPGGRRIALALTFGAVVHSIFALAILSMITVMFTGMTLSPGRVPWPLALFTNALLLVQFPLVHSVLLSRAGARRLSRMVPGPHGKTLSTTTYAIVASVQLLALFGLWTPSGIVWWRAEGGAFVAVCVLYATSWALLGKAIWDAGADVQSGALGWMSLMKNVAPNYPDMPTTGLFRIIRQPIYVAFALTLWTIPVWTPDQLAVAVSLTAYCLAAPMLKERRFAARYGERFERYRQRVPYALPFKKRSPR
ncbi:MAG: isoprenylcysteine carboxylmethyltransferase family protein [Pseudomonadota bacterium]